MQLYISAYIYLFANSLRIIFNIPENWSINYKNKILEITFPLSSGIKYILMLNTSFLG